MRLTSAGTAVTTYDPAPGFTPEQLAKKLRAQGKASVRVVRSAPADGVTVIAPGDCSYGSAGTSPPPTPWSSPRADWCATRRPR
ncbi:hypothetical protein AB0J90_18300 [Micromonospora sp. NPDC049523]|uniref:hypothetical protein n=1 Tax=Micromonospora sp. NPDC049523 TaxID=3155921 RepID=UPI00343FB440